MIAVRVQREPSDRGATIGALYVNDYYVAWTLEDQIRERPNDTGIEPASWVKTWKVQGETAIPAGRYPLVFEWSPKFQMMLPEMKDVPGFLETKFHAGNRKEDTDGCILVGRTRARGEILTSRDALAEFIKVLRTLNGSDGMFVDVINPPGLHLPQPSQPIGETRV